METISGNEWFVHFVRRLLSIMNTLTVLCLTYSWLNTHVESMLSPSDTFVIILFIKSQFAISVRNILHLNQCTQEGVWPWTAMPFQMPPAGLTGIKMSPWSLFVFSWNRMRSGERRDQTVDVKGFLVLVWELIPEVSPVFQTHPVYSLIVHHRVHKRICFWIIVVAIETAVS